MTKHVSVLAGALAIAITGALAAQLGSTAPAAATTVTQRLHAVEKKTDFYRTRVSKNRKRYFRHRSILPQVSAAALRDGAVPEASAVCSSTTLVMLFPTNTTQPAISNVWLGATITWPLNSGEIPVVNIKLAPQGGEVACSVSFPAGNQAPTVTSVTFKKFCALSVDAGQNILVSIDSGGADACRGVTSIDATVKMTNQEMIEPE